MGLYQAFYSSTDDADLDHETTLLEHHPQTPDEIIAACRKYQVKARVVEDGEVIGDFVPSQREHSRATTMKS